MDPRRPPATLLANLDGDDDGKIEAESWRRDVGLAPFLPCVDALSTGLVDLRAVHPAKVVDGSALAADLAELGEGAVFHRRENV
jgi:hypothetical protein